MRLRLTTCLCTLAVLATTSCKGLDTHRRVSSRTYEIFATEGVDKAQERARERLASARAEVAKKRAEVAEKKAAVMETRPEGYIPDSSETGDLDPLRPRGAGDVDDPLKSVAESPMFRRADLGPEKEKAELLAALAQADDSKESEELAETTREYISAIERLETVTIASEVSTSVAREIEAAIDSDAKYLVSAEPFYSVGAVVAFDNDLDATSIPVVSYNLYPFGDGSADTLGMQFLFGGALSGNGSGGSGGADIGLALGGGFFMPVGSSGTLSAGHMAWDEGGNGQNGWYIGINIGAQAQSTNID